MRLIAHLDALDYDPQWRKIRRRAVRAIIWQEDKLLMISSKKYGEAKFPGGGINENETNHAALIRETAEETGRQILTATIQEYGIIIETRRRYDQVIFEQYSYYYTCAAAPDKIQDLNLDAYERDYGYTPGLFDAAAAIAMNEQTIARLRPNGNVAAIWAYRENIVLRECRIAGVLACGQRGERSKPR